MRTGTAERVVAVTIRKPGELFLRLVYLTSPPVYTEWYHHGLYSDCPSPQVVPKSRRTSLPVEKDEGTTDSDYPVSVSSSSRESFQRGRPGPSSVRSRISWETGTRATSLGYSQSRSPPMSIKGKTPGTPTLTPFSRTSSRVRPEAQVLRY